VVAVVGVAAAPLALGVVGAAPAGAAPNGFMLLVDPSGSVCQLAGVDLATGAVTPIGSGATAAKCANDLAETSTGQVFGIQEQGTGGASPTVHLRKYDTTTGASSEVGQIGTFNAQVGTIGVAGGVTFDKNGNLFVQMFGAPSGGGDSNCPFTAVPEHEVPCLYRVDPTNPTNGTTFVGQGPVNVILEFLAAACDGRAMTLEPPLGATGGSKSLVPGQSQAQGPIQAQIIDPNSVLGSVNLTNGAVSAVGVGVGATNFLTGIAFDSAGTLWGVGGIGTTGQDLVGSGRVFTINTTTGVAAVGSPLTGGGATIPFTLALPLNCPTPPPAAAPVVITPRFTG
jgi:hypothetical protein